MHHPCFPSLSLAQRLPAHENPHQWGNRPLHRCKKQQNHEKSSVKRGACEAKRDAFLPSMDKKALEGHCRVRQLLGVDR